MELLDRYLQAIEFWLPKRQRQDIIAELSEDLRSQIEEKETELGRKLEDAEVEAILKRCGAPLEAASRYRPQQYLIGPALAAANIAIAGVNLFRPYWTPRRASLRLLSDGLGAGLFCWLLKAHVLAGISAPSIPTAKAIELTNLINTWMGRTLPWAIVTMLVILSFDVYRIMRLRCVHLHGGSIGPAVKDLSSPMANGN
jgi:hypothetical protein